MVIKIQYVCCVLTLFAETQYKYYYLLADFGNEKRKNTVF